MYRYRVLGKHLINNKWLYSVQIIGTDDVKMLNTSAVKPLLQTNLCTNAIVRSNCVVEIYDVEQAFNELVVALDGSNKLNIKVIKVIETKPNRKRAYMKIYNNKGIDITLNVYNLLQRNTSLTSKGELSLGGSSNANLVDVVVYSLREQAAIFQLPNVIDTNYRSI
ncbi:MAG: hypothetical protein E7406_01520 [Ruminococcaceae bacterium]|nr:hypothetical protein [Oscillospiraceae bacterium]